MTCIPLHGRDNLLQGNPAVPAVNATVDLPPVGVGPNQIKDGLIMTRLDVWLAPGATVGEVNAALDLVRGRIVSMRPGLASFTIAVPLQSSLEALHILAQTLTDRLGNVADQVLHDPTVLVVHLVCDPAQQVAVLHGPRDRRRVAEDLREVRVPRPGGLPGSRGGLALDGRAANRGYVGDELLRAMKPDVIFLNTSRGFVVDSLTLATFLQGHPEAVALLDVHDPEPFDAAYPLLGLPNARLFPHMAASTRRADLNMSWVVRDVAAVLAGDRPRFAAPPAIG